LKAEIGEDQRPGGDALEGYAGSIYFRSRPETVSHPGNASAMTAASTAKPSVSMRIFTPGSLRSEF
jgi:hypothetical protein